MHRIYLFLFLFTMGTTQLHGQQLSIGQIPFRLGMTMTEATAVIHDPIYLDDGGKTDTSATWYVREKHGENNFVLIGTIIFRNGRAETLARDLKGFFASDSKDVGNALFQALEQLKREDPTVSINTRRWFISSESGEVRTITIGTGLHRIEIRIPDIKTAEMTITEVLTLAKQPPK
jgi:hypothetical protein